MKKLLFLINPNAGLKLGRRFLPDILARLCGAGYLCSVYVTEKRGDAEQLAAEEGGRVDLVVACGGDGTLNEVITGMQRGGHRTTMGYIPCGSTNDFAAGMGIPTDVLKATERILTGDPRPLDIGRFGEARFFSYTASFGAFTSVSYSTPQNVKNILGHAAYILSGIRSLGEIRPIRMRVEAAGQTCENDYIFGGICNSTSLGGILKLDDSAVHMNDGLFEALLIAFPRDILELNRIMGALRTRQYSDPALTFIRAPSFRCVSDAPMKWTLDGEEAEGGTEVTVENIHLAITLMV